MPKLTKIHYIGLRSEMKSYCVLFFILGSIVCSHADDVASERRREVERLLWSDGHQSPLENLLKWREKLVSTPGIKEELMAIVRDGAEGKGDSETIGKAFHILRFRKDVTGKDEEELLGPLRNIARKGSRWTAYEYSYALGAVWFLKDHYSESRESILIDLIAKNEMALTEAVGVLGTNGSVKAVPPLRELQRKHQPNPHTDEDIYQLVDVAVEKIERREGGRPRP